MPLPMVIIPVFNALEHLRSCLESVRRTVPVDTRIVLIDDASTDARVLPLLQSFDDEAESHRGLLKHPGHLPDGLRR